MNGQKCIGTRYFVEVECIEVPKNRKISTTHPNLLY